MSQTNLNHSIGVMLSTDAIRLLHPSPLFCYGCFRTYDISVLSGKERKSDDYFRRIGCLVSAIP